MVEPSTTPTATHNRLAQAHSAYLRSAAHQPIDWYEFGPDAFERAKTLDRPILLDIGAVWCHWCHVIDRESYEDAEIAQLINEYYVPVKVDRDERPDVDSRYQQIVVSMTGHGGWPLTAFLTYDGRVLHGGTYYPPAQIKHLLQTVQRVYHERKETLMADTLMAQQTSNLAVEPSPGEIPVLAPEQVFEQALDIAQKYWDQEHGGFGSQPKFPHFSLLAFLIQLATLTGQEQALTMLTQTLTAMAQSGTYDHVGGGFHRYSVDRHWHVPHFEKMAYDQGEAMAVYAQAYRLTEDPLYRDTVLSMDRYIRQSFSDPDLGGFYASQDADIDLEDDGDYFTWTLDELKACLSVQQFELAVALFGATDQGNMHGRPGRNVLRLDQTLEMLAQHFGWSHTEAQQQIQVMLEALYKQRCLRQEPYIDKTLYLNWNGMMLCGYFQAATLLEQPEMLAFAVKTLDRLLTTHVDQGQDRLWHVSRAGTDEGIAGFLDDYAWMIAALLQAYQATGSTPYLDKAIHWADRAITLFEDTSAGGFFDTADVAPTATTKGQTAADFEPIGLLKFRQKPTDDTPSSSANGVMIRNLLQLALLTGRLSYRQKAKTALTTFSPQIRRHGIYVGALLQTLFEYYYPPLKLDLLGTDALLQNRALTLFSPGKVIHYQPSDTPELRVCYGTQCYPPVTTVETLMDQLKIMAVPVK